MFTEEGREIDRQEAADATADELPNKQLEATLERALAEFDREEEPLDV